MTGMFEILDYSDRLEAYKRPRVIISDAGFDNDMVCITIGDKDSDRQTVKVVGRELIKAVECCTRINHPYL